MGHVLVGQAMPGSPEDLAASQAAMMQDLARQGYDPYGGYGGYGYGGMDPYGGYGGGYYDQGYGGYGGFAPIPMGGYGGVPFGIQPQGQPYVDPATGYYYDPTSGQWIDPATGQPVGAAPAGPVRLQKGDPGVTHRTKGKGQCPPGFSPVPGQPGRCQKSKHR